MGKRHGKSDSDKGYGAKERREVRGSGGCSSKIGALRKFSMQVTFLET